MKKFITYGLGGSTQRASRGHTGRSNQSAEKIETGPGVHGLWMKCFQHHDIGPDWSI